MAKDIFKKKNVTIQLPTFAIDFLAKHKKETNVGKGYLLTELLKKFMAEKGHEVPVKESIKI